MSARTSAFWAKEENRRRMFDLLAEGNSMAKVAESLGVSRGAVASAKGRYDAETLKLITPDGLVDVETPKERAKKKVVKRAAEIRRKPRHKAVFYGHREPLAAGSPETWGVISSEPYPRDAA